MVNDDNGSVSMHVLTQQKRRHLHPSSTREQATCSNGRGKEERKAFCTFSCRMPRNYWNNYLPSSQRGD
jgi:hypothetical protein